MPANTDTTINERRERCDSRKSHRPLISGYLFSIIMVTAVSTCPAQYLLHQISFLSVADNIADNRHERNNRCH